MPRLLCIVQWKRGRSVAIRRLGTVETRPDYSYEDLADRIEAVLGERPSLSALRAAHAEDQRRGAKRGRPRITAGMPRPRASASRTAPARFASVDVEAWLTTHPRRRWDEALRLAGERLAQGDDEEATVRAALEAGLSWAAIAGLLSVHEGRPVAKSSAYYRFGHLDRTPPEPD